eukprot:14221656-Heterocapsa_arctica.AAC.1
MEWVVREVERGPEQLLHGGLHSKRYAGANGALDNGQPDSPLGSVATLVGQQLRLRGRRIHYV